MGDECLFRGTFRGAGPRGALPDSLFRAMKLIAESARVPDAPLSRFGELERARKAVIISGSSQWNSECLGGW